MSITLTQNQANNGYSPLQVAFIGNVTAGNLLVIVGAAIQSVTTLGVTDSLGNAYTRIASYSDSTVGTAAIWWAIANSSGPNTVTVTSGINADTTFAYLHEFASPTGWPAAPFDAGTSAAGSGPSMSSGSITTAAAGELVFGYCSAGIKTPGPGFTVPANDFVAIEYLVQPSAGAIAATATQFGSGAWQAFVAAFKPAPAAPTFAHYRTITIDHTQLSAAQTNFPVLVRFSDPTLKSTANGGHVQSASGFDIVLTSDQAGTQLLSWEVEKYDPAAGSIVLWVQAPAISSTADTVLYLQYGNANITTSQTTPTAAWESSFAGVWHLSNPANLGADSTVNANNGTNHGATSNSDASIGASCASFVAANSQYISVPDAASLNPPSTVTLSGWMNPQNQTVSYSNAFGKLPVNSSAAAYGFWVFGTSTQIQADINEASVYGSVNLPVGSWTYAVMTYDGATISLYFNGVLNGSMSYSGPIKPDTSFSFVMGANTNGSLCFNGSLAEIQLSSSPRSAAYIAAAYANQKPGSTLLAIGPEGTPGTNIYTRAFADTLTILEALARLPFKAVLDSTTIYDLLARQTSRSLLEAIPAAESFRKGPAKFVLDSKTVTDAITRKPAKAMSESFSLTERIGRTASRAVSEAFTLADSIGKQASNVIYEFLNDAFTLTDSLVRRPAKAVSELFPFSENLAKRTTRKVSETFALADALARQAGKAIGESLALAESLAKRTGRTLAEGFALAETFLKQSSHQVFELFADAFTLADSLVRQPGKAAAELFTISEAFLRNTSRFVSDAVALGESLSRSAARTFAEALSLLEAFATSVEQAAEAVRLYVAELWQRLWPAETTLRLWSANEFMIYADPKDAESVEDFELDWSLAITTDPITASTWEVPAPLTQVTASSTTTTATVRLGGGAAGAKYVVKNLVTLRSGQVKAQTLLLPVR